MDRISFSAALKDYDLIRVSFDTSGDISLGKVYLETEGEKRILLAERLDVKAGDSHFDFRLEKEFPIGKASSIFIEGLYRCLVKTGGAVAFEGFDDRFYYDGPLGAEYRKSKTTFRLWAPVADEVYLKIKYKNGSKRHLIMMDRGERGVYVATVHSDCEGAEYTYLVKNDGRKEETIDPYGLGSTPNGVHSIVVDQKRIKHRGGRKLPPIEKSQSVIYEINVRDMSADPSTDIVHKGGFLGLSEEKRKTEQGNPAGLDYIASLGVSHVQVMPILDFKTVDENNPSKAYNWGYDPAQYFVFEGSYCSDPSDPYLRIIEAQKMVDAFHKKGIRVVLDVVYNHVYAYEDSSFEKCVPQYYWRHGQDGTMKNRSGCGNDLDGSKKMVRRLIKDSCLYLIETLGIDGFRFDLMGLIDLSLIKEIKEMASSINPDFVIYGEGWMMDDDPSLALADLSHAKELSGVSFFNDRNRETLRKFAAGDWWQKTMFECVLRGCAAPMPGIEPLFLDSNDSINYIECHDDMAYFDILSKEYPSMRKKEKCDIVRLANAMLLLCYGIPFIHAGQEIGQSKYGKGNTYNAGDVYNRFSYRTLDERKEMYTAVEGLIRLRKECRLLHLHAPQALSLRVHIREEDGFMIVNIEGDEASAPFKGIEILYNIGKDALTHSFGRDRLLVVGTSGYVKEAGVVVSNVLVSPHSLLAVTDL